MSGVILYGRRSGNPRIILSHAVEDTMKKQFSRHKALEIWLSSKIALTCFFQKRDGKNLLTGYVSRRGRTFFVREFDDGGFDIFIAARLDNDAQKTLNATTLYLDSDIFAATNTQEEAVREPHKREGQQS